MRIAVLTGLLACTLVFAMSSQKAAASEDELLSLKPVDSVSLQLVAVADTTESDLLPEDQLIVEPAAEEADKEPDVIEHVVDEDESLSDVAKQHETTWRRLFDKNTDIEDPNIINEGDVIIIPLEDEELEERDLPTPPAPVVASSRSNNVSSAPAVSYPVGSTNGNLYAAGNCTWHVKELRPDLPNNLGNANTWFSRAAAQGFSTGYAPRVGAVATSTRGSFGHVAYVTAVHGDGTITVSDMNYRALGAVTTRTVPASTYSYIY